MCWMVGCPGGPDDLASFLSYQFVELLILECTSTDKLARSFPSLSQCWWIYYSWQVTSLTWISGCHLVVFSRFWLFLATFVFVFALSFTSNLGLPLWPFLAFNPKYFLINRSVYTYPVLPFKLTILSWQSAEHFGRQVFCRRGLILERVLEGQSIGQENNDWFIALKKILFPLVPLPPLKNPFPERPEPDPMCNLIVSQAGQSRQL